jgi:hypothetical protein
VVDFETSIPVRFRFLSTACAAEVRREPRGSRPPRAIFERVKFLYGDCSPAPIGVNYVAVLRDAIAMAVEILIAEDRLHASARRRRALGARIAALEERLEALRLAVRAAVGNVASAPEDDPVTRCANQIERSVDAAVERGHGEVRALEENAARELGANEHAAHAACVEAVSAFVRDRELPEAVVEVELELSSAGYRATSRATTPYHVASERVFDLEGTPFVAADVRAGALRALDRKVEKLTLVGMRTDAQAIDLALRTARDRRADGVDLRVSRNGSELRVTRVRRGEAEGASDVDPSGLAALAVDLDAMIAARPARLEMITIDGVPVDEHERPSQLVDRVFAAMAPVVHAIVDRSVTPGELRLLRDLGDDRREEIFLPHAALADAVAQVSVARRRHFEILGLPGVAIAAASPADGAAPALSDPSIAIGYDD